MPAQTGAPNVTDRVRFLDWRDDVSTLLRAADVFVLPSLHEGLPLSVLEAARAGTPVIASRIGGTDEVITDGVNGLLFPPGEVTALAAAIERIRDDAPLARRIAAAASERVASEFDAAVIARRVESVYEDLLHG